MSNNVLFVDTSAYYALSDKKDSQHEKVTKILQNRTERLLTSNYILDELITLFRVRGIPVEKFSSFIDSLWHQEVSDIYRISSEIEWGGLAAYEEV